MFKRSFLVGVAILVAYALSPASVQAVPIVNGYNGLFFENAEVFINNVGDDPYHVDVGDQFWGVMNLQNIKGPTDPSGQFGPEIWGSGEPPAEITAYFASEVIFTDEGDPLSPFDDFIQFGATIDPNGILPVGSVLRVFEDSANNYNNTTQATGLATATDGTPSWLLGLDASTDGDSAGGYWWANSPVTIPTGPVGTGVGSTAAGFNFINPDGTFFNAIDDPNEFVFDLLVEAFFNAEIFLAADVQNTELFHLGSNDPAVINVVPEPTTMLLLGFGLIGLAGIGRSRFFKKD